MAELLSQYNAIGFDMDHALAAYVLPPFIQLVLDSLAKFLVEELHYSDSLLQLTLSDDHPYIFKGSVLDLQNGWILHLNHCGVVTQAFWGGELMNADFIVKEYGQERIPSFYKTHFCHEYYHSPFHRVFENAFDFPGLCVYDEMMRCNKLSLTNHTPLRLWQDLMKAFHHIYNSFLTHHSEAPSESYYARLVTNPEKYVEPLSPAMKQLLNNWRKDGKVLFLVTSSDRYLAAFLLEFLFQDKNYQSYFDVIIASANKPFFFTNRTIPLLEADAEKPAMEIEPHGEYRNGNVGFIETFLRQHFHGAEPKVVYIGDSVKSDNFPVFKYTKWDNWCVIDELKAGTLQKPTDDNLWKSTLPVNCFECSDGSCSLWFKVVKEVSAVILQNVDFLTTSGL